MYYVPKTRVSVCHRNSIGIRNPLRLKRSPQGSSPKVTEGLPNISATCMWKDLPNTCRHMKTPYTLLGHGNWAQGFQPVWQESQPALHTLAPGFATCALFTLSIYCANLSEALQPKQEGNPEPYHSQVKRQVSARWIGPLYLSTEEANLLLVMLSCNLVNMSARLVAVGSYVTKAALEATISLQKW